MVKNMTKRLFGIVLMMLLMTTLSLKVSAGPITVKGGIEHGTVTVDKATANPGETVTITVTPALGGYYCLKENVKAELTIDGGSAQAPGLKVDNPGVGSFIEIQGNAPTDLRDEATYTFTMPEAPYGVQVSAEFSTCSIIYDYFIQTIPDQEYTGSEITPNVIVADGDHQLTLGVDYVVEFSNNVEPGLATCTVRGISRYTGQQQKNFTIYRETYEVRWGQGTPWDSEHVIPMTKGDDGKWVAADQNMDATSQFKVVKKYEAAQTDVIWYGAVADGDMYWINEATLNTDIQLYKDNKNLYFPKSGIYTFTFDPTTNKLKVSGDIYYNVTVATGIEHGSVAANPTSGKAGDQITITATAATGYKLSNLYINGERVVATDNEDGTYTYILTMPAADVTVTAEFSQKLFYITKASTENGSFDVSMNAGYMGDFVEIYTEPSIGYTVDQVTVTAQDGTQVEVTQTGDRYRFAMPASDVTVAVTFKLADYTITVANIQNGTVEAPATAHYGDEVNLTVTPAAGYELETLTYTAEGGEPVAIENNKFTMPNANVTINATFKEIVVEYYFDVVEEIHCTLLNETNYHYSAPAGATITMRVVPDGDYKLKQVIVNKVTGDGPEQVVEEIEHTISVENGNTYFSFVMPAGNVQIHAICAKIHTITLDDGDDNNNFATIDNEEGQAIEGETVTIRTFVGNEYKVSEIYYTYLVNGVEQRGELTEGENGVYTFAMPDADVTVVVRFDYLIPRHVVKFFPESEGGTVSVTANGTAINSMDQVAEVSIIEATVTPDLGYEVESFKVYEGIHNLDDDFLGVHEVSWDLIDGKYRFEMPLTDITIIATFKQIEVELEGVAFTAARKWATYYNGTKNLALLEGIKAYVVTGVANEAVVIDEIGYIPAGVGVLLYSENAADQVTTTIYTGETGSYTSMLVGSDEAQTITAGYVLYNNNFIRSEAGTVAAHRCYLPATQVAGAPRILKIGLGDVPTAIESIIAQGNVAGIKYVNINGMTSNEPFRGINIAVITFTDGTTRTVKVVK